MVAQAFYGCIECLGDPYETYDDDNGYPLGSRQAEAYSCHAYEQGGGKVYACVVFAPQELYAASGIDEAKHSLAPLEGMGFVSLCHSRRSMKLPTAAGASSAGHAAPEASSDTASSPVVVRCHYNHRNDIGNHLAHLAI